TLGAGGGKIFAGGGVVYVGTTGTFSEGYSTVNASNLDSLSLLSGVDAANIAGQALAANGSGLMISVGDLRGQQGQILNPLDISNVTDPSNTGNFVTRITLSGTPKGLALANGLAFVAVGSAGLQIVNYLDFDTNGVPPNVSITANAVDADPATPGVQVLGGRTLHSTPTVTDDVRVRNLELLVNGQVVADDAAFPFDLAAQVPTIASGGNTVTLQARATDTGGNVALSNVVQYQVVPDT